MRSLAQRTVLPVCHVKRYIISCHAYRPLSLFRTLCLRYILLMCVHNCVAGISDCTHFSTTTRAHFFSERVINVWNALSAEVIDFAGVL